MNIRKLNAVKKDKLRRDKLASDWNLINWSEVYDTIILYQHRLVLEYRKQNTSGLHQIQREMKQANNGFVLKLVGGRISNNSRWLKDNHTIQGMNGDPQ